jgi:hypothetical protein
MRQKKNKNINKIEEIDSISKCEKLVTEHIAVDFHDEAKEIIKLTTEETRNEIIKYFGDDNENVGCLVLDKAKHDLIAEGKLVSKENDAFGKPFMM